MNNSKLTLTQENIIGKTSISANDGGSHDAASRKIDREHQKPQMRETNHKLEMCGKA